MENKKSDVVAIDSMYKKHVLENRGKLIPIIETIIFCVLTRGSEWSKNIILKRIKLCVLGIPLETEF